MRSALRAMGMNEYGELYAFDDGAMPKYEYTNCASCPESRSLFTGSKMSQKLTFLPEQQKRKS